MQDIIFYTTALFITISAYWVITTKNSVHAVLFLIFSFFNAATLFILIGAEYVAMTLIIVYVGAVAVLFLFVIMMLDIDVISLKEGAVKNSPLAILLGLVAFASIYLSIKNVNYIPVSPAYIGVTNTQMIGRVLYTEYFIPFQLAGVILLIAMLGAIVLTIQHTKNVRRQDIIKQVRRVKADCIDIKKVEFNKGVVIDE